MYYIITTETFPNGLAATQRIRCYAKSIIALKHSCMVLCVNRCEDPDNPLGNIETKGKVDGFEFCYLGKSTIAKKSWRGRIDQVLDSFRLFKMMLLSFKKKDKVILYTYNLLLLRLVAICSKIKGFNVFFELNEHPLVLKSIFGIKGESRKDLAIVKNRLSCMNGVLCISLSLKELLIRCGIEKDRIHVINMLVDSSRFIGLEKQATEPYIGYCGAADNNKDGVNTLIKAFSILSPRYPDLKLYIMGPKRSDCENEELAKSLGLEKKVVFTGIINHDQLPQKLVNARVLALARPQSIQAQYGFPTKLGEYLLSGNPVVVTSVGDVPFFLKNNESAYLADPASLNDFVTQLDNALSDSSAVDIGRRGRQVAESCFSSEAVQSQIKRALEN